MADKRPPTRITPDDEAGASLWSDLGRLAAQVLPPDWTLVGGLMVQLHAYEAGETGVCATTDIDILGDARRRTALEKIAQALESERVARQSRLQQAEADFEPLPLDAAAARAFSRHTKPVTTRRIHELSA